MNTFLFPYNLNIFFLEPEFLGYTYQEKNSKIQEIMNIEYYALADIKIINKIFYIRPKFKLSTDSTKKNFILK